MLPGMLGKAGAAALGVGSAFVAMGASSATALTKLADNAKILGISARQLDNWRNTARIAGGDADAFQESLNTLNKTFFNLKIGEVDKGTIQALGMSQADFGAMQKMPMQERIQYVLTRLEAIKDPEQQKALTAQLLGQNGLTMLANNQLNRTNFAADYQNAASRNLYSEEDYATALKGKKSLEEIRVSLDEVFNKIGISIEKSLLGPLTKFSSWLDKNGDKIDAFANSIGNLVGLLTGDQQAGKALMLGGEKKAKAFDALAALNGVDISPGTNDPRGAFLMMSPEWSRISKAMDKGGITGPLSPAGNAVMAGMFDPSRNLSQNQGAVKALMDYAAALAKAGDPENDILSREKLLTDRLQLAPNIVLTVNVDKSGNVSLVNQGTGKVINSLGIRQ